MRAGNTSRYAFRARSGSLHCHSLDGPLVQRRVSAEEHAVRRRRLNEATSRVSCWGVYAWTMQGRRLCSSDTIRSRISRVTVASGIEGYLTDEVSWDRFGMSLPVSSTPHRLIGRATARRITVFGRRFVLASATFCSGVAQRLIRVLLDNVLISENHARLPIPIMIDPFGVAFEQ